MKILSAALLCVLAAFAFTSSGTGGTHGQAPGISASVGTGEGFPGIQDPQRLRPVPELDLNVRTGPAVGSRIPEFEARDQQNRRQDFESLRGPKGLMLLFYRSADW
jgi:hypothetical protein